MKSITLNAAPRTHVRKHAVKKLRASGRVPAVIYGQTVSSQAIELSRKDLDSIIRNAVSQVILVDLNIENDERPQRKALVQSVQRHVLSGEILHLDLYEVASDTEITVNIPIDPIGEAVGVKDAGGTLARLVADVKIKSTPAVVPQIIRPDISHMQVGETLLVKDLPAIEGVEYVSEPTLRVLTIIPPRVKKGGEAEDKKKKGK